MTVILENPLARDFELALEVESSVQQCRLENRCLPKAYQALGDWLVLFAGLGVGANAWVLTQFNPSYVWTVPLGLLFCLGYWTLGLRQVCVPRVRGIVDLQDLARAIIEHRRPTYGWHGVIRHRVWRHTLFCMLVALGIAVAIIYGATFPDTPGNGGLGESVIAESLYVFAYLVIVPVAYLITQVPNQGSLVGALFACSALLFAGGAVGFTVAELATTVPIASADPAIPAYVRQRPDLLHRIAQRDLNR